MRVAFGEGFANALAAMATGTTLIVDTTGAGQAFSGTFDVESGPPVNSAPGWYSEQSVWSILYDLFDSPVVDDDPLGLGFGPIYSVFVNQQANTPAFTSIFSFITNLKAGLPANVADIDTIVGTESIDANTVIVR
jgi:hypothetical protein